MLVEWWRIDTQGMRRIEASYERDVKKENENDMGIDGWYVK